MTILEAVGFNTERWAPDLVRHITKEVRSASPKWVLYLFDRFGWTWPFKLVTLECYQSNPYVDWQSIEVAGTHSNFRMTGRVG